MGGKGLARFNACPHGHFPTVDGKWVAIACTNDKMFARLAGVMGKPELAAADMYQTVNSRLQASEKVDHLVRDWCLHHDQAKVVSLCEVGEVPLRPCPV